MRRLGEAKAATHADASSEHLRLAPIDRLRRSFEINAALRAQANLAVRVDDPSEFYEKARARSLRSMKSVDDVARILSGAGAAYALIGGHAVNAVLEPRFTADIDVTIAAEPACACCVRSLNGGSKRARFEDFEPRCASCAESAWHKNL